MCRAEPEAHAPFNATKQDLMRKTFQEKAAIEAQRKDGLTDEQRKAMTAEFDRRILTFQGKWRLCPGRLCRRKRTCIGPPFTCLRQSWMPPYTHREYRRLRRDIVRSPPRIQGA
jgi:hypothetical protein